MTSHTLIAARARNLQGLLDVISKVAGAYVFPQPRKISGPFIGRGRTPELRLGVIILGVLACPLSATIAHSSWWRLGDMEGTRKRFPLSGPYGVTGSPLTPS